MKRWLKLGVVAAAACGAALAACVKNGATTASATDGPVCSESLAKSMCRAERLRAEEYAFRGRDRRYIYDVFNFDEAVGSAVKSRVRTTVVKIGDSIGLLTDRQRYSRAYPGGIRLTRNGIEVDEHGPARRYVIFPAVVTSAQALSLRKEWKVPAGTFGDTVEVEWGMDERPEGGRRLAIRDRAVFAKGVGIIRREIDVEHQGKTRRERWELAAIEEPTEKEKEKEKEK